MEESTPPTTSDDTVPGSPFGETVLLPPELIQEDSTVLEPTDWLDQRLRALLRAFGLAMIVASIVLAGFIVYQVKATGGCEEVSLSSGYSEVVAHGYKYKCVSSINTLGDAPDGTDIVGLTEPKNKVILILATLGSERAVASHENAHALAEIYADDNARAWYDKKTGASSWYPKTSKDYWRSGVESFAETYALCTLGLRNGATSDYLLGDCGDVFEALGMMRAATKP